MTLYDELAARSLPLIQAYHSDLEKADRQWIEDHPGVPFIHATRDFGTDIVELYPADDPFWPPKGQRVPYLFGEADRDHILEQAAGTARYLQKRDRILLMLYYDGQTLRETTAKQAVKIAEDYDRSVRWAWAHARPAPTQQIRGEPCTQPPTWPS